MDSEGIHLCKFLKRIHNICRWQIGTFVTKIQIHQSEFIDYCSEQMERKMPKWQSGAWASVFPECSARGTNVEPCTH